MKKIGLIITGILFFTIACDDEAFLDKKPHALTDRAFYTSVNGALQGLNAAYDILQLGEEVERIEFIGTVCSGDAMAGGEAGGSDQGNLQNFMRFLIFSDNGYASTYWRAIYRGIYRCNLVIKYLSLPPEELEVGFEEKVRKQIIGEATFLRGLFHFKLQASYGGYPQLQVTFGGQLKGVPFIDHALPPDEWFQERPTLEYTWGRIEQDFADAAELLLEKSNVADAGRATRGAALSMLAKTYLYQEKWNDAYTTAKQVIESGQYWLMGDNDHPGPFPVTRLNKDGEYQANMPGYQYIWQPEANNCGESVFDVQHYMEGSSRWPQGFEGSLPARYYGPRAVVHTLEGVELPDRTDGPTTIDITTYNQYFWGFILPTDYFVYTAFKDIEAEVDGEILDPRFKLSVVDIGDKLPVGNMSIVHTFSYWVGTQPRTFNTTVVFNHSDSLLYGSWFNWPTPGRSTWKYFTDPYFNERASNLGDMPQNTKYLRFADILLMGAEAAVHAGQNADALAWINRVRQRARNSGNTNYPQDYAGTVTLKQIYAERRVELAFEGHQYYDLVRTGRANQVLTVDAMQYPTVTNPETGITAPQQFGDAFQSGKHEIWPIPAQEIINTEGSITQNPNYE